MTTLLLLWLAFADLSLTDQQALEVCTAAFAVPANADVRRVPGAFSICKQVARTAISEGVDPVLAVAVAYHESRFRDIPSNRGVAIMRIKGTTRSSLSTAIEQGALQVKPKWHCPQRKLNGCDTTLAGVRLLKGLVTKHGDNALRYYRRPYLSDPGYAARVDYRIRLIRAKLPQKVAANEGRLRRPSL